MRNVDNSILQGIMTVFACTLSNGYHFGTDQANQVLLMGILSVLTSVYPTEHLINSIKELANRSDQNIKNLRNDAISVEDLLKTINSIPPKYEIQPPVYMLTPREREVLILMANGLMNKEIAKKIGVREGTIKCHVKSIFNKLNVSVRTEAVVLAIKRGLININESLEI